jgi:hypothetical protein
MVFVEHHPGGVQPLHGILHSSSQPSLQAFTRSQSADTSWRRGIDRSELRGDRSNNLLRGNGADDWVRGGGGDDRLIGFGGDDQLYGDRGNDLLRGGSGDDRLVGGLGSNRLFGQGGHDRLIGGKEADWLVGGLGQDWLVGGGGNDRLTGGGGKDLFELGTSSKAIAALSVISDFTPGQDRLKLVGKRQFEDLRILQGRGTQAGNVLIRHKATGEFLVILQSIQSSELSVADFLDESSLEPSSLEPSSSDPSDDLPSASSDPQPIPARLSISATTTKFSPSDSELAIAATGAATIQLGSQTLYIGTQQVTSLNQNPILTSFDSSNPSKNWVKTNYEVTGTDGRGYGLFWSGTDLYAIFSVDGTQGTPDQDFRRVSGGATQSWLHSYGAGGGAKVAVLARLNLATGDLTEAVYLSAINSGKSNSLAVTSLTTNSAGNLVVSAQSYYAPRRPDGTAMTQMTTDGSPFEYKLEITPELKTVISTAAIGWS